MQIQIHKPTPPLIPLFMKLELQRALGARGKDQILRAHACGEDFGVAEDLDVVVEVACEEHVSAPAEISCDR